MPAGQRVKFFNCRRWAKGLRIPTDSSGAVRNDLGYRTAILLAIVVVSLAGILPSRFAVYSRRGHYYNIEQVIEHSVTTPAVVSISPTDKKRIFPYMAGFQLNTASIDGPVIYVRDLPEHDTELISAYPNRHFYRFDVNTRKLIPFSPRPIDRFPRNP